MSTVSHGAKQKRLKLFAAQRGLCCYCERPIFIVGTIGISAFAALHGITKLAASKRKATFEHLKRRADGGTGHADNLALACINCNSRRGEMSWVEFKTRTLQAKTRHAPRQMQASGTPQ